MADASQWARERPWDTRTALEMYILSVPQRLGHFYLKKYIEIFIIKIFMRILYSEVASF